MESNTKARSFQEVLDSENLVLVDFFAEWCGPCKMMKPILEEVKHSVGDRARVIKVDVDKNTRAAALYQITGVPTLILFKKGKPVWRQSGVVQPATLREVISTHA